MPNSYENGASPLRRRRSPPNYICGSGHEIPMATTLPRGLRSPKKTAISKARIDDDQKNPDIVITLNRKRPVTRAEFVIDALESVGAPGLYVNALLRGWNVILFSLPTLIFFRLNHATCFLMRNLSSSVICPDFTAFVRECAA